MPFLVTTGSPLLTGVAFGAVFVLVSLALGRRLLRWLGARSGSAGERAVLAFAVGAGMLQFVPFALGAAGILSVLSLRLALLAVALATGLDLLAVLRRARAELSSAPRPEPWLSAWLLCLVPALGIAFLLALAPTFDPDGLAYHLTVPKRWLQSGTLNYLPTYVYSNTPMGIEFLFMGGLAVGGDVAAKVIHFVLGSAAGAGLFLAGLRLRGPVTGVLAATLGLVGPAGCVPLLGWAYLEGGIALAMAASALAWLLWFRTEELGWLRCSWLLAGVAVSFKITSAPFPVAIAVLSFFSLRSVRPRQLWRDLAGLAPFAAFAPLPWFVRSAIVTGNPLFPLFPSIFPTRDYSTDTSKKLEFLSRFYFWAGQHDWSLERRKLILAAAAAAIVAAGVVALVKWRSPLARATSATLMVATLVQLSAAGLYMRYWIPWLAVACLPPLALLEPFFPTGWRRGVLVALAGLGSLGVAVRGAREGGSAAELLRADLGGERRGFLVDRLPIYPLYEYVNRELPRDARVLVSFYCGTFYIDRTTYCGEFAQDALRWTSWDAFVTDFKRLGITHVLAPTALTNAEPPPPEASIARELLKPGREAFFRRLLLERGRLLTQASDQGVFAINVSGLR